MNGYNKIFICETADMYETYKGYFKLSENIVPIQFLCIDNQISFLSIYECIPIKMNNCIIDLSPCHRDVPRRILKSTSGLSFFNFEYNCESRWLRYSGTRLSRCGNQASISLTCCSGSPSRGG